MADIIPFCCEKTKRRGFTIAKLPMPDDTYRAYKEYGGTVALKTILTQWKNDCEMMKHAIAQGQSTAQQCNTIPFKEAVNA